MDIGQLLLQRQHIHSGLDVIAVVTERTCLPAAILVVGDDHAALAAGGEVLGLCKREAAHVADRADGLAFILAADGLRAVLDNVQVMLAGNGHDAIHVTHNAIQMDNDNALGALGDLAFDVIRVDGVALIHVAEDGHRTRLHHRERGRDERVGRHDHLIARADAQRRDADVQRSRAVGAGNCHLCAAPLGELVLKFHALMAGPVADRAGVECFGDFRLALRVKLRPAGEAQLGNASAIHDNFFFLAHVKASFLQV